MPTVSWEQTESYVFPSDSSHEGSRALTFGRFSTLPDQWLNTWLVWVCDGCKRLVRVCNSCYNSAGISKFPNIELL